METQKIVKALELAIKNSTYTVIEQVGLLKKEPVEHINGETLKASVQSIIDLCKEEYIEPTTYVAPGIKARDVHKQYVNTDAMAEQLSK